MTNSAKKLNLDKRAILDKQFNIDFKGYSCDEVDAFLDLIMQDYDTLLTTIVEYRRVNEELERSNATCQAKLIELEGRQKAMAEVNEAPSQVDILKRLARLEKEVYSRNM